MIVQKFPPILILFFWPAILLLPGCDSKKNENHALFVALDHKQTGIDFINKLTPTQEFNMFNYMYFYNGAGIGAGDFNNDGKVDLFFASNQGENKLYLNKGKLQFEDITTQAALPQDHGWSTGVSVIDINNDGLLDIYVCKVGKYETLNSKNQLLICTGINKKGIPAYEDKAAQYGLDFSGFSTQAVFFDYDSDGDNDMFLLNHSVHQSGSFADRKNFIGTFSPLSGDRIFRNEGSNNSSGSGDPLFKDVTASTGIHSSAIGYGLGVVASDINLDGLPDLYIGNDFHENDYLYINRGDGTFADETDQRLMHTSKFTMGVDVADVSNDGLPEIISTDMLAADPYILKRSFGDDEQDIFFEKIRAGYNYQYSRNALQYQRSNGSFSELGAYAGIHATDWSWAPLWVDFDNDGLKDLFISNGIPKRLNDMDYINFVADRSSRQALQADKNTMKLIENFPQIKIPNKFYKNSGDMQFSDIAANVANDKPTYSNGAVYADLDNDGDLDIVVNNIDDPALVYENRTNNDSLKPYIEIKLKGPQQNINAIGARLIVFEKNSIRTYEHYPVRGFQSSMQTPLHAGLGNTRPDSVVLIWPDNTCHRISADSSGMISLTYTKGLPHFDYNSIFSFSKKTSIPVQDITSLTGILYKHIENPFNEFNREPLLPHMVSAEGPALAIGDINGDGLEDVFIGASKTFHRAIYLQQPGGKFIRTDQSDMEADSMYEDTDAIWIDVNNDHHTDLVIASGGNEFYGQDKHLMPRVYLNDGKANFTRLENAFQHLYLNASCVRTYDFNKDGFTDLFIGGRNVPWEYGEIPQSYLLQNDGTGKFIDVTKKYAETLANVGMVTGAQWVDLDKDSDNDLVVCCEWGGIYAFINDRGIFIKKELTDKKGWWNFILPVDVDGDGDLDFIAGNLGLNSRLKASVKEPLRMYHNDFDDNGKKEQAITYYVGGKEVPFATKDELQKQLPFIKKKFLYAGDFAAASVNEIFGADKLKKAQLLSADYFSNAILINDGNLQFTVKALPWEAQLAPYRDAVVINANNDNLPDILLAGNYYDNNIQLGRYDADFGTVLVNQGRGNFNCETLNEKPQLRHIKEIKINRLPAYILANNNDSVRVIRLSLVK